MAHINYRIGQEVQAREAGGGLRWFDCKISRLESAGATVTFPDGSMRFANWGSLRPRAVDFRPSPGPKATFADALTKDLEPILEKLNSNMDSIQSKMNEAQRGPIGEGPKEPPPYVPPSKEMPEGFPKKGRAHQIGEFKSQTDIGNALHALRINADLSQQALGKSAGIFHDRLARLERGDALPKKEEVVAICKALKVEPDQLLQVQLKSFLDWKETRARRKAERAKKIAPFMEELGPGDFEPAEKSRPKGQPEKLEFSPTEKQTLPSCIKIKYGDLETEGVSVEAFWALHRQLNCISKEEMAKGYRLFQSRNVTQDAREAFENWLRQFGMRLFGQVDES